MNKKTRLVLVAVLLVAFVAILLAACTFDDSTTTTDAEKLYAAYSVAVSAKGYKPVSKTEFEKILKAATKDGGTITSVNATLETANGTEKWVLTFVLGDGTTKTAEHAANKADSPDPDPNPTPDPDPTPNPTGNDGKTADTAYTVADALIVGNKLANNAYTSGQVYLKGTIIWAVGSTVENGETYTYMYIADTIPSDSDDQFAAYVYVDYYDMSDFTELAIGDEVVLYGYLMHIDDATDGNYISMTYYTVNKDAGEYIDPVLISVNGNSKPAPEPDPSEHNFPNYFTYGKCQDEGCHVIGRKAADSTFKNNFKYTLTETD